MTHLTAHEVTPVSLPYPDARFVRTDLKWFLQPTTEPAVLMAPPVMLNLPEANQVQILNSGPNPGRVYTVVCSKPETVPDQTDYYYIDSRFGAVLHQRQYNLSNRATMEEWYAPGPGDIGLLSEIFAQLRAQKQPFDKWEKELNRPAAAPSLMALYLGNVTLCTQLWGSTTRVWLNELQTFHRKTVELSQSMLATSIRS